MTFVELLSFLLLNTLCVGLAGCVLTILLLAGKPQEEEEHGGLDYHRLVTRCLDYLSRKPQDIPRTQVLAVACATIWIFNLWHMLLGQLIPPLGKKFDSMDQTLLSTMLPTLALIENSVLLVFFRATCCSGPDLVEVIFWFWRVHPRQR